MSETPAGRLLKQLLPALGVGIGSALVLLLVDLIAEHWLHDVLWKWLPDVFGISRDARLWIFIVLTCIGVVVGLVVWLMPGHAGPDPATVGLMHAPGPLLIVPSLLLAAILGLAGGVSLGPEFPIMGANAAIAAALGMQLIPRIGKAAWGELALAGTLGALFGTPIAAALMLTEALATQKAGESVWDRLFAPLAAAAAGALTATAISGGTPLSVPLPDYPGFKPIDLVTGSLIACGAVVVGLLTAWIFPYLYTLFQRLRHPLLIFTAGGILLGLLGAIGGEITLFKGLHQMNELATNYTSYGIGALVAIAGIKLAALLVAATTGFRGGRIFPAVFIALAFGFLMHAVMPSVPVALAVACSVLGLVLVFTQSGWLSIFMAAVLVAEPVMLVILCVAVLPAWLLVTGKGEMIVAADH